MVVFTGYSPEMEIGATPISIYRNATDNTGRETTIAAVVANIIGSRSLATTSKRIRAEYAAHGKSDRYDDMKRKEVEAALYSGVYSPTRRGEANWVKPSGLIVLDVDDVTEQRGSELLALGRQHPAVALSLPSFRLGGTKWVAALTPTPTTAAQHLHAYQAAEAWMRDTYGVAIDDHCSDPNRLCFLASDSTAVLRTPTQALAWQEYIPPKGQADAVCRVAARKPTKLAARVCPLVTPDKIAALRLDAELLYLSQKLGGCDAARDCLGIQIALMGIDGGEQRYRRFAYWHTADEIARRYQAGGPQDRSPLAVVSGIARRHGFNAREFYMRVTPKMDKVRRPTEEF